MIKTEYIREYIEKNKKSYKKFTEKRLKQERKKIEEENFTKLADRRDIFFKFQFLIENTEDPGVFKMCHIFRAYYRKYGRLTEKQMDYLEKQYHRKINQIYTAYQDLKSNRELLLNIDIRNPRNL